jgi:hypothetical protein
MNVKMLSQETWPLLINQKPMDTPKVAGYIKETLLKLITTNQTIDLENYHVRIQQIPYSEGYFKMDHDPDKQQFTFESIYRVDYSGQSIENQFGVNQISLNVKINGIVPVKQNSYVEIQSIHANYFYHNQLDDQSLQNFVYDYINSDELKEILVQSEFYKVQTISVY